MGNIAATVVTLVAALAAPPVTSLPGSSYRRMPEAEAVAAARHAGPGNCRAELTQMQGLPYPGSYGWDPHFDRIMVNFAESRECLLQATADPTPIRPIGLPGLMPLSVGDLAHVLLAYGKAAPWDLCLPKGVGIKQPGNIEPYTWLKERRHRKQWHKCLLKELAPNNSSKPTPLRGAA